MEIVQFLYVGILCVIRFVSHIKTLKQLLVL